MKTIQYILITAFILLFNVLEPVASPIVFTDSSGYEFSISTRPNRIVSLVPSVTEMLLSIGVDTSLVGFTYHSTLPSVTTKKVIVGGFAHPSIAKIESLQPDLIFYSGIQKDIVNHFQGKVSLINLQANSTEESFDHIHLLGDIFDQQERAHRIISEQKRLLDLIERKTAHIDNGKKLRVMRLMGQSSVMTPGDDSFQNEYIRRAGGIPPSFGRNGSIIPVTMAEWQNFNPQALYSCGDNSELRQFLQQTGWKDVEAVRENRIFSFPCDLTCRVATKAGNFVSLLAARLYPEEFSDPAQYVLNEGMVSERPLQLDLDYVTQTKIIESNIRDFRNKTVVIEFNKPMQILSTLAGERKGITTVANHFFPPPSWGLGHNDGLAGLEKHTLKALGMDPATSAFLFTGADMDNLAVVKKTYRDIVVYILVTAGVKSNALRMGTDTGNFYPAVQFGDTAIDHIQQKPGTINILLLANVTLSPRAMTKAIINITEAKSAAMQDLDVRSTPTPLHNQATGTGTDNIIVVQGSGVDIDRTGGHTKIGQLIAEAVYQGIIESTQKQNGLTAQGSIFLRLQERHINLYALTSPDNQLRQELEELLLQPSYADFLHMALTLSDTSEKGLLDDPALFHHWCLAVASQLAGRHIEKLQPLPGDRLPLFINNSLSALITGLQLRSHK
ncbi:MAG: adenosylcobinamide amidohydrolase [Deltaproteobacteria bacterium]|nr:adenosylcobinamide amidohydrolase [Deltaproteobacteria bacterium]